MHMRTNHLYPDSRGGINHSDGNSNLHSRHPSLHNNPLVAAQTPNPKPDLSPHPPARPLQYTHHPSNNLHPNPRPPLHHADGNSNPHLRHPPLHLHPHLASSSHAQTRRSPAGATVTPYRHPRNRRQQHLRFRRLGRHLRLRPGPMPHSYF